MEILESNSASEILYFSDVHVYVLRSMRQFTKDFGSEREQPIRTEKNPKLYYTFRVPKKDVYRPDQVKELGILGTGAFCEPNKLDSSIHLNLRSGREEAAEADGKQEFDHSSELDPKLPI